jgi:release factor H-coupled RctB family protein
LSDYTLIANERCWIEDSALTQLARIAALPGVVRTVGLPDLHPGKTPIGAVALTKDEIYPFLVGNDIGCGIGLFETGLALRKFNLERASQKLEALDSLEELPVDNPYSEPSPIKALGTIGGGNHFLELQAVEKVYDESGMEAMRLDPKKVQILVHSGSRNYGQAIFQRFIESEGPEPLPEEKRESYLTAHDDALVWARRNRFLSAKRVSDFLGGKGEFLHLLDSFHNFIELSEIGHIHRKGAVSALSGPVVIPGSRGSLSYIARPTIETEISLFSLSHGAGRKWRRSVCKGRLSEKHGRDGLRTTALKSMVICRDKGLLYEEAPEAYKNIIDVIGALIDFGLCEIICSLRPLITLKI